MFLRSFSVIMFHFVLDFLVFFFFFFFFNIFFGDFIGFRVLKQTSKLFRAWEKPLEKTKKAKDLYSLYYLVLLFFGLS